jgi:LuxR family maltose regulon positive regulatory protein
VLLTKLHIPTPPKYLVYRKRLFDKLNEGLERKLILISAPAGFGKTTMVTQWIKKDKIPTAWFSIDDRDNDPYGFFSLLITSIQTVRENVGKQALELLKLPGTVGLDHIIEMLINDLVTLEKDLLLVLDDFHLINNDQVIKGISFLLQFKPEHFHVTILTRSDPSLPIARLRSQNEIIEIRSSDLSFSEHDTSALFKKLNLQISSYDIKLLDTKVEGWIAGLQLVALTIQGKKDKSEYIAKIAGDNRYIMDYLIEEVLDIQDDEIQTFLLYTSILERLSASLCDSLLKTNNSQMLLETLEKDNMFIMPLDNERKWYRYHHLFADLLRKRLIVQHKVEVLELHKRASIWFENNNMPLLAIEHALKAKDKQRAMLQINQIVDRLWETSQYALVLKFGSLFSEEEILSHQNFAIIYAWSHIICGDLKTGHLYLDYLEKSVKDKNLLGRIYETFNLLKVFSGEVESAFNYSQMAIQNISEEDLIWRTWAFISNGESHLLRFELDQCIQSFQKARENASKANNPGLSLVAEAKTAYALRLSGRYSEAYQICKDLLDSFHSDNSIDGLRIDVLCAMLYSTIGFIQIERNNIEEGIKNALKGYELSRSALSISFKGYSAFLLAESYYKVGNIDQALETIEGLEDILDKKIAQWLSVLGFSLKSKLLILKGDMENAGNFLKNNLKQDQNHVFGKYFNNISFARFLLEQYKYEESIDLLDKLSRWLTNDEGIELLLEVELLKAKAYLLKDLKAEARDSVIKAIHHAQSDNLIRVFINEGEQIEELIKEILKEKLTRRSDQLDVISKDYLTKLTIAFELERKREKMPIDGALSNREIEVLKLLSNKLSNNEIADTLYISLSTVKTHISHILSKLEAKNRTEATEIAIEKGLLKG